MAYYVISSIVLAGFAASAYWNDHPLLAVFFAASAASNMTAGSLSSRMDNIDAIIEKRVERIWDEIANLKNR